MLAPCVQHSYTQGMRKYLDIPLTVVVTTVLTAAMLQPLEAAPIVAAQVEQIAKIWR